jgi:hypothetical protein
MAVPIKDSLLVPWGDNFDVKVTLSPVSYNLTAANATSFHAAYTPYAAAVEELNVAREAGVRSKSLTAVRSATKAVLLKIARELYGIVQDSNGVSDAKKEEVGVKVRKTHPTPQPTPDAAPAIAVLRTAGNTVTLRLLNAAEPARRGRPLGVDGAAVFSYVGPTPPTAEADWHFEGNTGVTDVDVTFGPDTAPGAKVWFTAYWFNPRKARGPAAGPVGTNLPGGAAMAA